MENRVLPRAVIVAVRNWFGAARLPRAFRRAEFHVTSLSFPGLLIGSCQVDAALFLPERGSDEELLGTMKDALKQARPHVVIPTDDAAVELLQAVAATARHESPVDDAFVGMLRDSSGDFRHHRTVRSRKALAALAAGLGVRAPAHATVRNLDEAVAFAARHGLPVVLKIEESFAGFGVSICSDNSSLRAALARAEGSPRGIADGLLAQSFVAGRTAMRAVVAWRGRVLAGLSAIKLETHPGSTGPSCVVEFIDHPEMTATASTMVKALGFSGFASLDFQLDDAGAAHLIELNPRPTPICHLGHHFGTDLCESLRRAIAGEAVEPRAPLGLPRRIVLFPQEWVRKQDSAHFTDVFHDVPWDEPALIEAYVVHGRGMMRWGDYRMQEERRDRVRALLATVEAREFGS